MSKEDYLNVAKDMGIANFQIEIQWAVTLSVSQMALSPFSTQLTFYLSVDCMSLCKQLSQIVFDPVHPSKAVRSEEDVEELQNDWMFTV